MCVCDSDDEKSRSAKDLMVGAGGIQPISQRVLLFLLLSRRQPRWRISWGWPGVVEGENGITPADRGLGTASTKVLPCSW